MSPADQSLKRTISSEPEGSEPKKRQKQYGEIDVSGGAPQLEESAIEAVATSHHEGTHLQTAGAVSEQGESHQRQQPNDVPDELSQLGGPGPGPSNEGPMGASQADSGTDLPRGNGSDAVEEAQKDTKKSLKKWIKILSRFIDHKHETGLFFEELVEEGHNWRPPMPPDERRRLMEELNERTNTSEPQVQDVGGSDVQPKVGLDFMGEFSTPVDSPKDAAAFLSIDLQSLRISPESALKLRVDQVQNIAFLVKKAEGILKGCVNANDCGTGKTVEALASIFFLAQRRQARPELGTHKAAFILCPHQALRGWQQTHARYFAGLLTLRICSKSLPPGEHSQLIDPPSPAALGAFLAALSPSDPQTSRTVIICTYDELSSPAFLGERDKEDCRQKELSLRGSKLTAEALEALKVAQKPILFDLNFEPAMIGTLIADEAHHIKHPKSRKAQAAYLLGADIHFLLTAYPVENKVSDFRGLLFALYKNKEWQINWPCDEKFDAILKLFDDDFDAFRIIDSEESMNYVPNNASPEYVHALRNGQHLWRLNPHAYRWLGHQMKFGPEFSRKVLGSIFRLCLLRRGVVSVTTLPSSGSNTISGILALPPVSIRTIEVSTGPEEQHYKEIAGMAFDWIFRDDKKDKAAGAARVANDNEIPWAAFDNFWDTVLGHITADLGLADVWRFCEAPGSHNSIFPRIDALIQKNTDTGMGLYYQMTRRGTDPFQPPADRASMVRHLVRRSPKLRWLLVKLEELKQQGEKVVVYCVHPLTQWLVEGVCSMAEFDLLSLRSKPKHGDETRAAMIDEFNDPTRPHDLLLSTFRILGHSVDLHADCHNMIIFELPDNIPDMLSAIGRIRRVGQTEPQDVSILTLKDSYDDYTLYRQSRKYATAILAFGVLGERLDLLAWHIDDLVWRDRLEYLRRVSESKEMEFLQRVEKMTPALEAVKLLAAGELLRQHLGGRYNRSHIPWHLRHSFIFSLQGFVKMKLTDFAGAQMDSNTETGREILHQAAQLPPVGPPTAEVEELSARLGD